MYVYDQEKHRLRVPTLGRKFGITHWFSCGADGLAYGHMITKISRVDRLPNFLRYVASLACGAPLITKVRRHTSTCLKLIYSDKMNFSSSFTTKI